MPIETRNPPQPKNPASEAVKNIIGAINVAVVLASIILIIIAFVYIVLIENYPKAIALILLACGIKYLFKIGKGSL